MIISENGQSQPDLPKRAPIRRRPVAVYSATASGFRPRQVQIRTLIKVFELNECGERGRDLGFDDTPERSRTKLPWPFLRFLRSGPEIQK